MGGESSLHKELQVLTWKNAESVEAGKKGAIYRTSERDRDRVGIRHEPDRWQCFFDPQKCARELAQKKSVSRHNFFGTKIGAHFWHTKWVDFGH